MRNYWLQTRGIFVAFLSIVFKKVNIGILLFINLAFWEVRTCLQCNCFSQNENKTHFKSQVYWSSTYPPD